MGQPITFFNNNNKSWSELPENPLLRGRGGIPTPGAKAKKTLYHMVEGTAPEQFN